jgi:UDPglucose 6-dehydrogenase
MRISIVGAGYVGLITAVGLADKYHKIVCVDTDQAKVRQINQGQPPFMEAGLEERLANCVNGHGRLRATCDYEGIIDSELIFICVGTPSHFDGSIDLRYIREAATSIGNILARGNNHHTVVVRSTVVPGTTEKTVVPILEDSRKKAGRDFSVAINPEFLQEGKALQGFIRPDKIVIGEYDRRAGDVLQEIYRDFDAPIIRTDLKTAEMIKYANNAFLATKISFINELGNLCKQLGIDVYDVARAIGHDHRIGNKFLNAGVGFGGSCLPKDVRALIVKANEANYEAELLQSVLKVNEKQPRRMIDTAREKLGGLEGKAITLLGLSFKPETDDTRETPALPVIHQLLAESARVKVYDPMVKSAVKLPGAEGVTFCRDAAEAIAGADCVMIITEWAEFRDESLYRGKLVIDGRRALDPEKARQICRCYDGIGW